MKKFLKNKKSILRHFKKLSSQFILFIICLGIALPFQYLISWADDGENVGSILSTNRAESIEKFSTGQARRNQVVGLSDFDAFRDPYFIEEQKVLVVEGTPSGPNGETIFTADNAKVYRLDEENSGYVAPSRYYELDSDVDVEILDDGFYLKLTAIKGVPLDVQYWRWYPVPGVQQVLKSKDTLFTLQKNGDIRSILLANSLSFEANELAGAFPLITPLLNVLPSPLLDSEGVVQDSVELTFYDIRDKDNYVFDDSYSEDYLRSLLYGDVLIFSEHQGKKHIHEVFRLQEAASLMNSHIASLWQKFTMLHSPITHELGRQLVVNQFPIPEGMRLSEELKSALSTDYGDNASGRFAESTALTRVLKPRLGDFEEHPFELRPFESSELMTLSSYVHGLAGLAASPENRSHYPVLNTEKLEAGTPEAKLEARLRQLTAVASLPDASSINPKKKFWKRFGASALLVSLGVVAYNLNDNDQSTLSAIRESAIASWHSIMANLPEAWYNGKNHLIAEAISHTEKSSPLAEFFKNLPTNIPWDHQIHAFKIPFTSIHGPMIPYYLKATMICALASTLLWRLPVFLSRFSKKVLNKVLPRNKDVGWTVYWTFMMRKTAFLYISLMEESAKMLKKTRELNSIRLGQNPQSFRSQIAQNPNSSALDVQSTTEHQQIFSFHIARRILAAVLFENSVLDAEDKLSVDVLKEKVGKEGYENLSSRYSLLLNAVLAKVETLSIAQEQTDFDTIEESLINDSSLSEILQGLSAELSSAEKENIRELDKNEFQKRLRARLAGSSMLFHKFKNGEVSENVVSDVVGNNFEKDMHTIFPFLTLLRSFGDTANPDMMLASDRSSAMAGLVGPKPLSEFFLNAAAWVGTVGTEELNYGASNTSNVDDSFKNPQKLASAVLKSFFKQNSQASFSESAKDYLRTFSLTNTGFAFQKFGERITVAQVKTARALLFFGTLFSVIGYVGNYDSLAEKIPALTDPVLAAPTILYLGVSRAVISAVAAYLTYRWMWAFQNNGMKFVKTERKQKLEAYSHLLSDMTSVEIEMEAFPKDQKLEQKYLDLESKLAAFYEQNDAELPTELFSKFSLKERMLLVKNYAIKNPPVPLAHNTLLEWVATFGVGISTTIIGMTVFGLTWGLVENLSMEGRFGMILGSIAGLGVLGQASKIGGRFLRAGAYKRAYKKLEKAFDNYAKAKTEKTKTALFEAIISGKELYEYFDVPHFLASVEGLASLTKNSPKLQIVAQGMVNVFKEKPPMDPRTTKRAGRIQKWIKDRCEVTLSGEVPVKQ